MVLDNIHNHYEKLVFEEVLDQQDAQDKSLSEGTLEDIVCVALNNLPARYVRYSIDIAFYLTPQEREQMAKLVHNAVKDAFALVMKNPHDD
jgi:competence protein ComFB